MPSDPAPADVPGPETPQVAGGGHGPLLAVAAFASVALVALLTLLPVPYVALGPGPVTDVLGTVPAAADAREAPEDAPEDLIAVDGAPTYPTGGSLDLTTVSLRGGPGRDLGLGELLLDWRDEDVSVLPRGLYYRSTTTREQAEAESRAEMTGSQESAQVAALRELGIAVPSTTTRRVETVDAAVPAADVLRPGDEVTSVAGRDVADFAALQAAVRAQPADSDVRLGILRGGKPVEVVVRVVGVRGTTVLGITPDVDYRFPFTVRIGLQDVGGPSAGTMFALGIVDLLTPGEMTGGQHVAGTGAIAADGTVEPIGGLRQKVVGAAQAGATWFLAPAEECGQVTSALPAGITVVGVSTLAEARAAVESIGAGKGADVPTCREVAARG